MSDTPSIASLLTGNVSAPQNSSTSTKIEIVALPARLQNIAQTQSLQGQIVNIAENGNVTIRTDTGDLVVRSDQAMRLQEGQNIEVRVKAGNPPVNAALRPSTQVTQTPNTNPAATQTSLSQIATNQPGQAITAEQLLSGQAFTAQPYNNDTSITLPFIQNIAAAPEETAFTALNTILDEVLSPTAIHVISDKQEAAPPFSLLTMQNYGEELSYLLTGKEQSPPSELKALLAKLLLPKSENNLALLPFRYIAAQLIGTEQGSLLSYNPNNIAEETTSPSHPRHELRVEVRGLNLPEVKIGSKDDHAHTQLLSNKRAELGLMHFEGFSQTRGFAVLRLSGLEGAQTPLYVLEGPIENLPIGSRLEVSLKDIPTLPAMHSTTDAAAIPVFNASYFLSSGNWALMEEIQQSLAQSAPQAAQVFSTILPSASAPAQMGASVFFFIAAMRSSDMQSWLGEKAIENLRRAGKSDLFGRLGREISALSRLSTDQISGEWRAMSIPLAWQNEIHKLAIYTRQENPDNHADSEKSTGRKTRFVMDLALSHIGPVQLDGLFTQGKTRTSGQSGRLELVLRTDQSFSRAMKQEMRSAYKSALDETQIIGDLSFQDHFQGWVRITPDTAKEYSADI